MDLDSKANELREAVQAGASTSDVLQMLTDVQAAERARCKRIVQLNQCCNGHHTHEGTTMGHYDVQMIAEIDADLPPRA